MTTQIPRGRSKCQIRCGVLIPSADSQPQLEGEARKSQASVRLGHPAPALPPRLRVDGGPGGDAEGWTVGVQPRLFGGNKGDSVQKEEPIMCSFIKHRRLLCTGSNLPQMWLYFSRYYIESL